MTGLLITSFKGDLALGNTSPKTGHQGLVFKDLSFQGSQMSNRSTDSYPASSHPEL